MMRTSRLARVLFVTKGGAPVDTKIVAREFPTVAIGLVDTVDPSDPIVDVDSWRASHGFETFDDLVRRAPSESIVIRAFNGREDLGRVACEVLARYQRHIGRRNVVSAGPRFDAVLGAHAALHDRSKPLVAAAHDRALDTWQWTLRLASAASLPVQLAALFHDIERLESEADRRGAELIREVLLSAGLDERTCIRACAIIEKHERRGRDPEVDLLADAAGLSFFSLDSSSYADCFGTEQTRRKIADTLVRMGASARARLDLVRLRRDVRGLVAGAKAA